MEEHMGRNDLALERTVLAAERTFSAWIRTGLAGVAGGLAVARGIVVESFEHQIVVRIISTLLVLWGASLFIYAILKYRRTCVRLMQEAPSNYSLGTFWLMTAVLLIVSALVFWITLQ